MTKKELVNIISELLIPIGFKKKSNYWVFNSSEITKIINLQKSQFGNYFYINYGYIVNRIPLNNLMMHIYNRVASDDENENLRINELLTLENNIPDEKREFELRVFLNRLLVDKIIQINTENDLGLLLKNMAPSISNIVPLSVQKYFNME
ncbi:MAG: DUF4304 domain-containing protein [Dysgonamonadaceae bacterium]|jgi:hypothetical protein|nr:DUF4304 domain-containing protein [Dysgonamonadaceae bacterium]